MKNNKVNNDINNSINKSFKMITINSMLMPFKNKLKYKNNKNLKQKHRILKTQLDNHKYNQQLLFLSPQKKHSKTLRQNTHIAKQKNNQKRYTQNQNNNRLHTSLNVFGFLFQKNKTNSIHKSSQKSKNHSNRISSYQQSKQNKAFTNKIQQIKSYLSENLLQQRLSHFSKQKGKNFIRIYKDQFKKIFVNRYARDRITTFFQFQYIQDYDSILKTLHDIFNMTFQQILVFTFLIMDVDRDGLISTSDIINLIKVSDGNKLIMRDCLKVLNKFKPKTTLRGVQHVSEINQNNFFQSSQLQTLVKYRMINKVKFDKNINFSNIMLQVFVKNSKKKESFTRNLSHHLFTLNTEVNQKFKTQQQSKQKTLNLIRMMFKNFQLLNVKKKVQINFQTFSKIFENKMNPQQGIIIPGIFIDFLYVLGGIALPNQEYLQVDYSVLERKIKIQRIQQQSSKLDYYLTSLKKFKQTFSGVKLQRY